MNNGPLIIGAGPAGTAAAIRLGQAGHPSTLIERFSRPTDKVCGDFLGVDAIERLQSLGVDPIRLGAITIHRLRLISHNHVTEATLPFRALGLSRRILDDALLHRAEAAGATLRLGETVRRLSRDGAGWQAHVNGVEPINAVDLFLATGKHDLRDRPRPGVVGGAIGMKMYYDLSTAQAAALAGTIELFLFSGGYAGLQCVEAGKAVLCIALRRTRFHALGGTWPALLGMIQAANPWIKQRLEAATPLLQRPLAVAGVPYGFLHRRHPTGDPDLFRLGDQAAVIPSLTGDGVAIALHSGVLAANSWHMGANALAYHRQLAHDLGNQMRLAHLLHKVALSAPLQAVTIHGARWLPGLLRRAARGTRVGGRASGRLTLRGLPCPSWSGIVPPERFP
ncbi:NAD(P)/FAD-dependent oxidoreductase [Rhodopila sp.]|uniref:NAD(P)/FAD-dependent oxidoreductase n=1 Tax=Rhodopila sp. TaxID=2480087 RepID=UPI003D0F45B8